MINGHILEQRHAQNLENCGEALRERQTRLDDGHQDVDTDGDPDLGFPGVGRRPVERFDAQVLFDPFEEELHLPPGLVQLRDGEGRQREVVGEEDEVLAGLGIGVADAPERQRVEGGGLGPREPDGLVAPEPRVRNTAHRERCDRSIVNAPIGHRERSAATLAVG